MKTPRLLLLAAITAASLLPPFARADDRQIADSANSTYVFRVLLNNQVKASAKNGNVTLTGIVPGKSLKILAEDTVTGLPGVTHVDDQIKATSEAAPVSDDGIAETLRTVWLIRGNIGADVAASAKIDVKNGEVTLSGTANSADEKAQMRAYPWDISGVKLVFDNLTMGNSAATGSPKADTVDDASVTAMVKYVWRANAQIGGLTFTAAAQDGVLTVSGDVKGGGEKDTVQTLTSSVRGVKSLVNNISVHDH